MKRWNLMAIAAAALFLLSSCSAIQDLLNPKPPAAPTGLTASQGTFTDKIALSWDSVSKADSYNIYKAASATGTYSKIGTSTSTSSDVTAAITAGTHYWFKVEAVGSNSKISAQSDAAEGWSKTSTATTTPGTPTGLTASQGTYTDKIVLSWTAVSGAVSYKVYEATSATGTYLPYTNLVTTAGAEISTTSADLGVHCFYKVAALNSAGVEGVKSASAEGWAGTPTPAAPTGMTATQGTYTDKITLSWTAVAGASKYYVYEATSATGSYTAFSGFVTTAGADINIGSGNVGTHFFYKASAVNAAGTEGPLSAYAEGWTRLAAPTTPTGLSVGSPTASSLYISWAAVTGAASYQLYRDSSPSGYFTSQVYTGSATNCTDPSLNSGTTYYYKVKATNAGGSSNLSSYASGTTSGPAQVQNVTATQGTYAYQITVTWNSVSGASKYYIYYATSSTGTYTKLSNSYTTTSENINGDYGTHYWFKVTAVDSGNVEGAQSAAAEGWQGGTGAQYWVTDSGWKRFFTNLSGDIGFSFWRLPYTGFTNGTYEIHAEKDSGSTSSGFGMRFGHTGAGDYWAFIITTSGYYQIYKEVGGVSTIKQAWTASSAIHTGMYQDNVLKVVANNSSGSLSFYINDASVACAGVSSGINLPSSGTSGYYVNVSSSSDSFPSTPVDAWFYQSYPTGYLSVQPPSADRSAGVRASGVEGVPDGVSGQRAPSDQDMER